MEEVAVKEDEEAGVINEEAGVINEEARKKAPVMENGGWRRKEDFLPAVPFLNDVLATKKVKIPNCPMSLSQPVTVQGGFTYYSESDRLRLTHPKNISIEFRNLVVIGKNSLKFIRYSLENYKKNLFTFRLQSKASLMPGFPKMLYVDVSRRSVDFR